MKFLKKSYIFTTVIIFAFLLSSCNSTKSSKTLVENLQPTNSDEAEVYKIVQNIQTYISTSQWDEWLAMYSDDAILTSGKNNVTKEEMRKLIDGVSYKITKMEVTKKQINTEDAFVSVSMIGNDKPQLETYHFKKINNSWLIVKETNP